MPVRRLFIVFATFVGLFLFVTESASAQTVDLEDDTDEVEISAPASSPPLPPAPVSPTEDEVAALRDRLEALEAREAERERTVAELRASEEDRESTLAAVEAVKAEKERWGVRLTGYVQVQYERSQLSEDELLQGDIVLNRDRFMVRRGRLRVLGDWEHFGFDFEVDGSTTRGPFFGVRHASVSFLLRNPDLSLPPLLKLEAGLTEAPFGYEVRLGQREMIFMERSFGSLAFFPGPVDVGLRAQGGIGFLRYDVAIMNGAPLDDRAGGPNAVDPTRAPDIIGRIGVESSVPKVKVGGGVSALLGTGFHAGHGATKNTAEWRDWNENGTVDAGEVSGSLGRAATPSYTFKRWALNADAQVSVETALGRSQLFAEGTVASNLDRGFFFADPYANGGVNLRELQAYVAFLQDVTRWGVAGIRYDYYDPDSDFLDDRRGERIPAKASIHTLSPIVGVLLPDGIVPGFRARLIVQYDFIRDRLGRDANGVPVDVDNNQLVVRVQGEF